MSEKYVIVHRSYDPVQSDLLGDILRENGILARVLGTRNGAVIGVGQNILQMHIEVPQSQAGEATDFLEAFFATDGEQLLAEQFPDEGDEGDEGGQLGAGDETEVPTRGARIDPGEEQRRPLFAAALALILGIIGAGHLYARRPATAVILTGGQIVAILFILSPEWQTVATGIVAFVTLVSLDFIGAQRAVSAHNRGLRASLSRQIVSGLALVAVAALVSSLVGPRIPEPEQRDEHRTTVVAPAY